jgi:serine/threonine protein kinase
MVNRIGQQLGNYRLNRLLGQGGFAQVYLGTHVHLGTKAAIKVLDNWTVSEEELSALFREARVLSRLEHPHIVRVRDFSLIDGTPFIVMDYAPNGTLEKRYPRGTTIPLEEAASYVRQVASALQLAHDHRVMHLDVKPANMLIARNNAILLSDFGIAQQAPNTRHPITAHVQGTPPYMAPEHLDGHPLPASDQFSLAVVLYEWLSGALPFPGARVAFGMRQNAPAPLPLTGRVQGVTPQIDRVILQALSLYPQQRFARVQDFAGAFEEAVRQSLRSSGSFRVGPVPPFTSGQSAPSPFSATQRYPDSGSIRPSGETVPAAPAFPVSSTVYPPQSTGVPEHPLVQQERSLIQRARDIRRDYERQAGEIQQTMREEEQAALTERQDAREIAEGDMDDVRHLVSQARTDLDTAGWGFWARVRHFSPRPAEPVNKQNPTAQFQECQKLARSMRERLTLLLRGFKSPTATGKAFVPVATIIALVFGLLLHAATGSPDHFLSDVLGGSLVMLCGLLGVFSLALLYTLRKAYVSLVYAAARAESASRQRAEKIDERYQERREEARKRFGQCQLELERARQTQLAELSESYRLLVEAAGDSGAAWSDERWNGRDTWKSAPPIARLGSLTLHPFFGLPPLPALFSSPRGDNLLIKTTSANRQSAIEAIQAFLLRLLVTQSPDALRFTIIDPSDLGNLLQPFLPLEGVYESLNAETVAIDAREIEQHLRLVVERIRQHGFGMNGSRQGESSHVLVVMGFPTKFSQDALGDLLAIVKNGPRCGVTTVIVADLDVPLPPFVGFDVGTLERACRVIEWNGKQFAWRDPDFSQGQFTFDTLPPLPLTGSLVEATRRQLSESASLEHNPFLQAFFSEQQQATGSDTVVLAGERATTGTTAWLGRSATRQVPASVTFRSESGSHLLMVGKQEEVATGLSLAACLSLAAQRAPRDLHYYVVDTGPKQEIATLLESLLPRHVKRVVTRQSLHAGLTQVITELYDLLQQRRHTFHEQEPDVYLLLHGLHRIDDLHTASGQPGSSGGPGGPADLAQPLSALLRQGPEVGIHVLVWCDRLKSLESALGGDIPGYIENRVNFEYTLGRPGDTSVQHALIGRNGMTPAAYVALYQGATAQPEKFRPYPLPSQEWLQAVAAQIARKTS